MLGFNHYAKLKRIIEEEPPGWFILLIDKPTTATNFKGEVIHFDHYYRLYHADGIPIRYGKFQQISRLAQTLGVQVEELPLISK